MPAWITARHAASKTVISLASTTTWPWSATARTICSRRTRSASDPTNWPWRWRRTRSSTDRVSIRKIIVAGDCKVRAQLRRAPDAPTLESRAQRVRVQAEPARRAALSFDDPVRRLERARHVVALDLVDGGSGHA